MSYIHGPTIHTHTQNPEDMEMTLKFVKDIQMQYDKKNANENYVEIPSITGGNASWHNFYEVKFVNVEQNYFAFTFNHNSRNLPWR